MQRQHYISRSFVVTSNNMVARFSSEAEAPTVLTLSRFRVAVVSDPKAVDPSYEYVLVDASNRLLHVWLDLCIPHCCIV